MSEQTLALADPKMDDRVAMAVASYAYECPTCYWKEREQRVEKGRLWPYRMRWMAKVQKPCKTCAKQTFHCSAGPWEQGKSSIKLTIDDIHGEP